METILVCKSFWTKIRIAQIAGCHFQACLFYVVLIFMSNTECNGDSSDTTTRLVWCFSLLFPSRPRHQPWRGLFSSVLAIQWETSPPSLTEMCLCKISMWWRVSFYPGQCFAVSPHLATCSPCISIHSNTSFTVWTCSLFQQMSNFCSSDLHTEKLQPDFCISTMPLVCKSQWIIYLLHLTDYM